MCVTLQKFILLILFKNFIFENILEITAAFGNYDVKPISEITYHSSAQVSVNGTDLSLLIDATFV